MLVIGESILDIRLLIWACILLICFVWILIIPISYVISNCRAKELFLIVKWAASCILFTLSAVKRLILSREWEMSLFNFFRCSIVWKKFLHKLIMDVLNYFRWIISRFLTYMHIVPPKWPCTLAKIYVCRRYCHNIPHLRKFNPTPLWIFYGCHRVPKPFLPRYKRHE